jgi:ABC-2 type transport system ATP-binding protein
MPSSDRTARARPTTIRILLGLLRRDGGEVSLLGADPWRDAVELHQRLAYVPGDVTLWPNLTGGEIVDLLGRLRGGINASRLKALTERFDLDTSKQARAYSRGNRQKVALLAALASAAELLLLNEPTAGLHPLMEATFRDCVNDERRNGRTILLSSHILSEAEALSDRVTIIRHGKLPGGTVSAASLLWLCPVALTISAAGLIGLRHRDLGDLGPSRPVSAVRERIVAYGSYEPSPASRGARVGRGH